MGMKGWKEEVDELLFSLEIINHFLTFRRH